MAGSHFTRIVAVLFLLFAFTAKAEVQILAEGGISQHDAPPCDLWHQDCMGYSSKEKLRSYYARLGLSFGVTEDLSVNVAGVWLGHAKKDSRAANDENCALSSGTLSPAICGDTQRYVAQTSASGLAVSLEYATKYMAFEGGFTYLHRRFKIQTQEPDKDLVEREDLLNTPDSSLNGFGYFFGLKIKLEDNYRVGAYVFNDNIGGGWPSGFSTVYAVSLEKRFKLQ